MGWTVLSKSDDFPRELRPPLQQHTAVVVFMLRFAMTQLFRAESSFALSLQVDGLPNCSRLATNFRTRALARATMAMGPVRGAERLGGWSAQGSDRCARVAARVIANIQKNGGLNFAWTSCPRPLAKDETMQQFEDYLFSQGVIPGERARCFQRRAQTVLTQLNHGETQLSEEIRAPYKLET